MAKQPKSLTTPGGTAYILNALGTAQQSQAKRDDMWLYTNRVNFFYRKNLTDPLSTLAELRMWFSTIRQPTQQQVRQAMILTIDEDYSIKAGGGAKSDQLYSSSLRWLQAHPVTGLDWEPVIIKKFSTRFEDVLITLADIEYLIKQTLTVEETRRGLIDDIETRVAVVCHSLRTGTIRMSQDEKTVRDVPFTEQIRDTILSHINTPERQSIAFAFIQKQIEKATAHIAWVNAPGHGILGDTLDTVCPVKTATHVATYRQSIHHYEAIRGLLETGQWTPKSPKRVSQPAAGATTPKRTVLRQPFKAQLSLFA